MLTPERLRAMLAQPLGASAPRTIFDLHFSAICIAVDSLPFERTCTHVPVEDHQDSSPWPNVFIGLRGDRIVAAIAEGVHRVPDTWRCTPLPDVDDALLCTPPDVGPSRRGRWARRWSALLRSAG